MYDLVNRNCDRLLATMKKDWDIAPYVWMLLELPLRDVARDEEFQRIYCSYWVLNGAGLCQSYRAKYFALLEREKRTPGTVNVEQVAWDLYETPVNKEKKALQFSFATKLVHMIRTDLPVYDRMVETFYFLPRSYAGPAKTKLANLLTSYQFLVTEYERVLREGLLAGSVQTFRRHFGLPPLYSDQKIIDTLIWKFVPFLEAGALRDGSVAYC